MRAVIDTNVLLSGLLWGGPPRALIQFARVGRLILVSSPHLLAEFERIVVRAKFRSILARQQTSPALMLADLRYIMLSIEAAPLPQPVCRDPDDDAVLALAIAAEADIIVSGDADLLVLGSYIGIPILTPAQAVARIDP